MDRRRKEDYKYRQNRYATSNLLEKGDFNARFHPLGKNPGDLWEADDDDNYWFWNEVFKLQQAEIGKAIVALFG